MSRLSPPKCRRDFEIAIICALRVEADAVEVLFDHDWDEDGDRYGKAPGDQNSYRTGVIGNHNVVLMYMPGIGKGHAASASASLRSSFECIRLALIVGVCGGVPEGKHGSIFLGDVIIGEGIVNYDFGRRLPVGFVRKDTSSQSNLEIKGFLEKLKSWRGLAQLKKKTDHHSRTLQQKVHGYQHPGENEDRLFHPTYHHKHDTTQACQACTDGEFCKVARDSSCDELNCDRRRSAGRVQRGSESRSNESQNMEPSIHFGLIASGDTVMRFGEDRDAIASKENVIAFEMEGAGVHDNLPCIVVKGVCDYADSHKDKLWQRYSAGVAAACMKSILEQWAVTAQTWEMLNSMTGVCTPTVGGAKRNDEQEPPSDGTCMAAMSRPTMEYELSQVKSREGKYEGGGQRDKNIAIRESGSELLGVIPRLDAAFKEVLVSLKEFRKYLPRDTDLRRALRTQRVKFQSSVEILISQAPGYTETIQSMISDGHHPFWNDIAQHRCISQHLGSSVGACLEVTQDIEQNLAGIQALTKGLKVSTKSKKGTQRTKEASETLKDAMEDLKSLTQTFSSLIPERRAPQLPEEPRVSNFETHCREAENFRIIQKAACSLYEALGGACSEHTIHNVHLSLQPNLNGTLTQVGFKVAFSGPVRGTSKTPCKTVWINVESVIKSTVVGTETLRESLVVTSSPLKRQHTIESNRPLKKGKRVKFPQFENSITHEPPRALVSSVPNLYLQRNLCTVVQRRLHKQLAMCNNCIGLLGDNDIGKHLVYIDQQVDDRAKSTSLSRLISLLKKNPDTAPGQYGRVRLARYLATAVLYYHATPWLSQTWRSQDVHFFGREDSNLLLQGIPQTLPYMSACIQASTPPNQTNTSLLDSEPFVRNPVLFGLGIMFLELAYEAPFRDLQKETDFSRERTQGLADFITAKRLADNSHTRMDVSFRRIVRKCLYCDFGQDSDFKSPVLQDAFKRDVIGGLEELEKEFRRLQLDD